jgi:hypothetical protein
MGMWEPNFDAMREAEMDEMVRETKVHHGLRTLRQLLPDTAERRQFVRLCCLQDDPEYVVNIYAEERRWLDYQRQEVLEFINAI